MFVPSPIASRPRSRRDHTCRAAIGARALWSWLDDVPSADIGMGGPLIHIDKKIL